MQVLLESVVISSVVSSVRKLVKSMLFVADKYAVKGQGLSSGIIVDETRDCLTSSLRSVLVLDPCRILTRLLTRLPHCMELLKLRMHRVAAQMSA